MSRDAENHSFRPMCATIRCYINARARTQSEMVAPIISNEEVIGVFDLESDELNAYSEDDLRSVDAAGVTGGDHHRESDAARAADREAAARRPARSRASGAVGTACRHAIRRLEGFDISAYNFPTEEVSGDYYDWVRIYDDQIGIVIADVSGKGVPAALLMAFLRPVCAPPRTSDMRRTSRCPK